MFYFFLGTSDQTNKNNFVDIFVFWFLYKNYIVDRNVVKIKQEQGVDVLQNLIRALNNNNEDVFNKNLVLLSSMAQDDGGFFQDDGDNVSYDKKGVSEVDNNMNSFGNGNLVANDMNRNASGSNADPNSDDHNETDFEREVFFYNISKDFDGYLGTITGKRHLLRVNFTLTQEEAVGKAPISYKRFMKHLLTKLDTEINNYKERRCGHNGYQPLLLSKCESHITLMTKCKLRSGTCLFLITFSILRKTK